MADVDVVEDDEEDDEINGMEEDGGRLKRYAEE